MPVLINPFRFGGASITGGLVDLQESTLNNGPWTFPVAIGTAAANRVVVVGVVIYDSAANQVSSVTITGNAMTKAIDTSTAGTIGSARIAGIYYRVVAAGSTDSIVVTAPSPAISVGIAVWAIYPGSSTPVDAVANENTTIATITAGNVAITSGGILCAVHQHDNGNATAWTWSGIDPVTEETDQQLGDSGIVWSVATIHPTTSTTTDDLQVAPASGTPNQSIACASWGP